MTNINIVIVLIFNMIYYVIYKLYYISRIYITCKYRYCEHICNNMLMLYIILHHNILLIKLSWKLLQAPLIGSTVQPFRSWDVDTNSRFLRSSVAAKICPQTSIVQSFSERNSVLKCHLAALPMQVANDSWTLEKNRQKVWHWYHNSSLLIFIDERPQCYIPRPVAYELSI